MKNWIIAGSIMMTTGLAFAESPVLQGTTIKALRVRENVAYINFEGCKRYAKVYMAGSSLEYYKALYVTAVAAATAKKKINVQFNEDVGCTNSDVEPTIKYLEAVY